MSDTMEKYRRSTVEFGEGSKEMLLDFSLVNEEKIPKGRDDCPQQNEEAFWEDAEEDDDDDGEDDKSENTTAAPSFRRRSLLTTPPNELDRVTANTIMASTPALRRSRTSTPHGPSVGTSPKEDSSVTMLGPHVTPPKPIVMNRSNSHHQMALSPRTTRKNMLQSEMSESLRKSIIWERQEKRSTALAVLKRSSPALVYPDIFHEECHVNCW